MTFDEAALELFEAVKEKVRDLEVSVVSCARFSRGSFS